MKKELLVLFVLFGIFFAGPPASNLIPFASAPISASSALMGGISDLISIITAIMITMIVVAAVIYSIGMLFGSETRARASQYAMGIIGSVFVAGVVIAALLFFLPNYGVPAPQNFDIIAKIGEMVQIGSQVIIGLVVTLIVLASLTYMVSGFLNAEDRARAIVWSTGLLAGAIFASILYLLGSIIIPQIAHNVQSSLPSSSFSGWGETIIQVTLLTFVIILITYLVARVLKVPEWEAYLSVELSNLVGSFLVLLFSIGFFLVGNGVAIVLTGNPTPPLAAIDFLQKSVAGGLLQGLFDMFQIQACASMMSTIYRRLGESVLTHVFKVFPGIDSIVSVANTLSFGLVSVYGSVSAQITILAIINSVMGPFFLPAGIILRFFPPTREAGSFLIAFAIGFQVIFPTTYLINAMAIKDIGMDEYVPPTGIKYSLCGLKYAVLGYAFNPSNFIFSQNPLLNVIGQKLRMVFSETLLHMVDMSEFLAVMKSLASLSLIGIFLPALSISITVAFINAMAKFLSGKV